MPKAMIRVIDFDGVLQTAASTNATTSYVDNKCLFGCVSDTNVLFRRHRKATVLFQNKISNLRHTNSDNTTVIMLLISFMITMVATLLVVLKN